MRARWTTSIDVRTQTEYGTLRAYTRAGFQTTTGETTQGRIYTERGFIQFAGFMLFSRKSAHPRSRRLNCRNGYQRQACDDRLGSYRSGNAAMSDEDLKAELERLRSENAVLKRERLLASA